MDNKILPVYNIENFVYPCEEKDFYTNNLEDLEAHLNKFKSIHSPHKHDFYFSVFVTKGKGRHEIDFKMYDIKPGAVFMMSPGQAHSWKASEDAEGYVFFHTKAFYEMNFIYGKVQDFPFYCSIHNTPLIQLKKTGIQKIEPLYVQILEEYKSKNRLMLFQKISSLLSIIYIELSRLYVPQKQMDLQNHHHLSKLRALEDLIDVNFKEIKSPAGYAEMMNTSEKNLNRICKETINKTASDIIVDRIILEARRLLAHSESTVAEIAEELGYYDHSYFSRLFKKRTSETPIEFINRYRFSHPPLE